MARFIFKMQNILAIKESLETQAKAAYAEAAGKVAAEEEKLQELKDRQKGYEDEHRQLSSEHLDIILLRRCNQAIEIMKQQVKRQLVALSVARKNLELARERLNEAMKERKTYEKLKENAFQVFLQELNDEEKKEIDELVSFTYNNKEKETGE